MADLLKIKISIADRVYPMTIAPDQEEGLRKAAKKIEGVIKQFEKNYAVRDKQDVLAMCALQFAAKTEQQSLESFDEIHLLNRKITALESLLNED